MQKILTSSQKPLSRSGKASFSELHEKNVARTFGQPLLVTIAATRAPTTTTVEAVAIVVSRRARRRRAAARAARRSTVIGAALS